MKHRRVKTCIERVRGGSGTPGGYWALRDTNKTAAFTPYTPAANAIPLAHSDVVVDIGAYVGSWSLRCARFPVKHVTAYEPTERTFEVLEMNAEGQDNFDAVRAAVVARDRFIGGEVPFYLSDGIGVRNSTRFSKRKTATVVPAVAYVDAVADATVIKIDVEGGEYDLPIVECITPALRAIAIEFHYTSKQWRQRAIAIADGFAANGFRPLYGYPELRGHFSTEASWAR